ncbi:MAG: hypothetical protein KY453_07345 [Gemmatimonadetes bacterium]|nr:hypothetical protein [Gemmatimonadota bacterium]
MRRAAATPLLFALVAACGGGDGERPGASALAAPRPASSAAVLAAPIPDSAFARLVRDLSEAGGYFDTDNLISNESSYLHVLGPLRERAVGGGAYVGVGPDQSFAYLAALRPELAFIVDVRRDNVLQHLLFKAVFALSPTRAEYLAHLVGASLPEDPESWSDLSAAELVERASAHPPDPAWTELARARVDSVVAGLPVPLTDADRATVRRFHDAFLVEGLDLRFRTHGRAPRPYYPTLRRLLVERDLEGREGSYLATEDGYRFVRDLQAANRVVPVVGDLAGEHAVRTVGDELRRRGLPITAFYTSNVEFYLWQDRSFDRFAANVAALPWAEEGVLIRSYFPNRGAHPHGVPGYYSTQTLQRARDVVAVGGREGFRSYVDLVTRDAIDPRPGG